MSSADAPGLAEVAQLVAESYPMIARGLVTEWVEPSDAEWAYAEEALRYLVARPGDDDAVDRAVEAFAVTSIDFLRLQARFTTTGRYARASADGLHDDLYGDDEEMSGHYLDGLAMTYALWPNHARLLRFMVERFVDRLDPASDVLEIGPGHGLLGHALLTRLSAASYTGLDISGPALAYAGRAFEAAGLSGRSRLVEGDATDLTAVDIPTAVDALVCCEVLEHVDHPEHLLEAIRDRLARDGLAFVSTVANLEAIDHVYLFDDPEHIRATIRRSGLVVDDELVMRLPGDSSTELVPYNYAAVLRRA